MLYICNTDIMIPQPEASLEAFHNPQFDANNKFSDRKSTKNPQAPSLRPSCGFSERFVFTSNKRSVIDRLEET